MHLKPIVLASKSPRRSQLLAEAGLAFRVQAKEVDETYSKSLPIAEVPTFLAAKKATACLDFLQVGEVLLSADTIVTLNNNIYEKPKDYEDGIRILSDLSGKKHTVITGVCMMTAEKKVIFSCASKVEFAPISAEEIHFYLNHYQPYDKAGAYAIQEWIGLCKIVKIEGTYANIMGLPVHLVYEHLSFF